MHKIIPIRMQAKTEISLMKHIRTTFSDTILLRTVTAPKEKRPNPSINFNTITITRLKVLLHDRPSYSIFPTVLFEQLAEIQSTIVLLHVYQDFFNPIIYEHNVRRQSMCGMKEKGPDMIYTILKTILALDDTREWRG